MHGRMEEAHLAAVSRKALRLPGSDLAGEPP
jgi:hypothetical protein